MAACIFPVYHVSDAQWFYASFLHSKWYRV